jgi:hypothetical protein
VGVVSAVTKKAIIQRPLRDPDHLSKRNVPYWWAPEWTRGTNAQFKDSLTGLQACYSYGKIKAIKNGKDVSIYMISKDGNPSYIQGSIQQEFRDWHMDRQIDYILLGEDPDSADELIINDVE